MSRAFYAGSFDPFTIGHADIVSRGLLLFDSIVIGVGINPSKATIEEIESRVNAIREVYADEPRVSVIYYDNLTTEAASETGAEVLLRSVRNSIDFEYERNLADINRKISGIETILLTARPELSFISSSMVRELRRFGKPTSEFIPTGAKYNCK